MNVTYKEIASFINKGEQAIKYQKAENPTTFEFLKNGALLKKYNCDDHEQVKKMIELQELIKDTGICNEQLKGLLEAVRKCKDDK